MTATGTAPSPALTYRKAVAADAPLVHPLIMAAYRNKGPNAMPADEYPGWTTEAHLINDDRISLAGIVDKINCPDGGGLFMALDESGELVACFELVPPPSSPGDDEDDEGRERMAYFGLFAVEPRRQGGGLGGAVLAWAEEFVRREWDVTKMELQVIGLRDDMIAWYGRKGYARTGHRREFPYGELVNGVALRDDLYFEVLVKELK
jgi:GNAT superfamily N-acetyltransferase